MSTPFRRLASLATLAAAGLGAHRVHLRRPHLAKVAGDLRSPILYAVPSVTSDRGLRIGRSLSGLVARATGDGPAVPRSTPDGVRVLVYDRPGRSVPSGAVLWIHGGGLVLGNPEQGHEQCTQLAEGAGVLVVSVDYRLAPEAPFPAGLDDCMAALRWLHAERRWGPDRCGLPAGPGRGRPGGRVPAPRLPHARRPHDPPHRPRSRGRPRVVAGIQPLRLDRLPRAPTQRRTGAPAPRRPGAARRPLGSSPGVARRG